MVELIWDNKKEMLEEVNSKDFLKTDKHFEYYKEESKNFDTTENLYIEGDNLEALKLLQKDYNNKIKMIYIDPPYNTEKKFIYNDTFRNKRKKECRHSGWLNMMYPRLKLAKNLLKDDGVIFISIDDNEVDNLKKICSEIFGENNFINCFIWNCSTAGGIRPKFASKTHEYIICYAKNIERISCFNAPLSEEAIKQYNKEDKNGVYREKDFIFKNKSKNINQKYFIRCPDGQMVKPKPGYIYRFIETTFKDALERDLVVFKESKTGPLINKNGEQALWNIYIKKYLGNATGSPATIIPKELVNIYNVGTQCVQFLFDNKRVFENIKPVNLIKYFLNMMTDKNDIILDFFSGTSTTAHAVMQLNADDGGNRKFIMVQLPEKCDEKSEAYKAGYENICEIGKERIRRAGDKIVKENKDKEGIEDLDIGFKVIKIK